MAAKKRLSSRTVSMTQPRNPPLPPPASPPSPPPPPRSPVDSYLVYHYGWLTADVTGCRTSILCYGNGALVGYVNFYDSGHVPESTVTSLNPVRLVINYPVERVQEVLDTLRREAPIHIGVDVTQRVGWVACDPAAVGHLAN